MERLAIAIGWALAAVAILVAGGRGVNITGYSGAAQNNRKIIRAIKKLHVSQIGKLINKKQRLKSSRTEKLISITWMDQH